VRSAKSGRGAIDHFEQRGFSNRLGHVLVASRRAAADERFGKRGCGERNYRRRRPLIQIERRSAVLGSVGLIRLHDRVFDWSNHRIAFSS